MPDIAESAQAASQHASLREIDGAGWWRVARHVWASMMRHNIGFLAAGVAFYAFLSLAPALGLVVMVYGLIASPETIFDNLTDLIRLMPAQAAKIVVEQLASLIQTAAKTHGWALLPAVAIALYGASGAASGVISSLNIIYDRREKRGFVRLLLVAVAIAAAAIFVALIGMAISSVVVFLRPLLPKLGGFSATLAQVVVGVSGAALTMLLIGVIYRYAPCRAQPRWRWLSLGSVCATALWLVGSVGFGWYVSIASYDNTYGSLATVVALLMWLFVSAYALLLGAIFEAEAERQAARIRAGET